MLSLRRITLITLIGIAALGGCNLGQVDATAPGTEVANWKYKPLPEKVDTEHTQTLDLQKGTRVEVKFAVSHIAIGERNDVRSPISATLKVLDSGGANIDARMDGLMHHAGEPLDERRLNIHLSMVRGGKGCTGSKYTTDTAHIKIAPDGKAEIVPPGAIAQ